MFRFPTSYALYRFFFELFFFELYNIHPIFPIMDQQRSDRQKKVNILAVPLRTQLTELLSVPGWEGHPNRLKFEKVDTVAKRLQYLDTYVTKKASLSGIGVPQLLAAGTEFVTPEQLRTFRWKRDVFLTRADPHLVRIFGELTFLMGIMHSRAQFKRPNHQEGDELLMDEMGMMPHQDVVDHVFFQTWVGTGARTVDYDTGEHERSSVAHTYGVSEGAVRRAPRQDATEASSLDELLDLSEITYLLDFFARATTSIHKKARFDHTIVVDGMGPGGEKLGSGHRDHRRNPGAPAPGEGVHRRRTPPTPTPTEPPAFQAVVEDEAAALIEVGRRLREEQAERYAAAVAEAGARERRERMSVGRRMSTLYRDRSWTDDIQHLNMANRFSNLVIRPIRDSWMPMMDAVSTASIEGVMCAGFELFRYWRQRLDKMHKFTAARKDAHARAKRHLRLSRQSATRRGQLAGVGSDLLAAKDHARADLNVLVHQSKWVVFRDIFTREIGRHAINWLTDANLLPLWWLTVQYTRYGVLEGPVADSQEEIGLDDDSIYEYETVTSMQQAYLSVVWVHHLHYLKEIYPLTQ
jgi:hypothetical protein